MGLRLLHLSTCSHIFTFHVLARGLHIVSIFITLVCWMGCGWGVGYGMAWDLDFYTFLHVDTFSHFTYLHVACTLLVFSSLLCVGWGVGGAWVILSFPTRRSSDLYMFTHFHISRTCTWLAHC